ncbi:MAG: J domain-containing protein [Isosphaeraceae bacterium]
MNDPYEQLGLPPSADDVEIRKRYLELVRQFPPDRAPERFAEIRAAYDALQDPAGRLEARLFQSRSRTDSLEAIDEELRRRLKTARFPLSVLASWADSA